MPAGTTDVQAHGNPSWRYCREGDAEHERRVAFVRDLPEVRKEKVDAAREAIARGAFDTEERLRQAIERMIADLDED